MNERTISYLIQDLVKKYKDEIALIYKKSFRTQKITYEELYAYSCKLIRIFEDNKIKKGDKIIIYGHNCPEWGIILLGCALTGSIAIPLDYNSNKDFVNKIKNKTNAKLIFCSEYKTTKNPKKEIYFESLFKKLENIKPTTPKNDAKEEDILEIVYTSGTTSEPKGVIITNKNIISNTYGLQKEDSLSKDFVFLSVLPLSHLFEQTIGFFLPLSFGCKIVYTSSRKSSTLLEAMQEEKVTTIVCVPLVLKTLKDKIENKAREQNKIRKLKKSLKIFRNYPIFIKRTIFSQIINKISPKLKFFLVGGAPLDTDVEEFWSNLGIIVLQGYGLTEASPLVTCNTFKHRKKGTLGRVLFDQKINVNENNEILCSGDNITRGYYKNYEATKNSIKEGWFHTGDIGKIDEQGFLTLTGRKKNMILTSSGMNVYPEDIEKKINKLESIKDSVVIGIKEKKDTIVTAIVMLKKKGDLKDIQKQANEKLASHQQIQNIILWPYKDFPRTNTLKIKRRDVKDLLKKKTKEKTKKEENKLYVILKKISNKKIKKIKNTHILSSDLAIDSLHRVELVSLIEDEFGVEIEEEKITEKTTVKDVEILISKKDQETQKTRLTNWNTYTSLLMLRTFFQKLLFAYLRLFYKTKLKGKEKLKRIKEPAIFISNHTSHLDAPTLLRALPRKIRRKVTFAAAKDYFFKEEKTTKEKIIFFATNLLANIYPFFREGGAKQNLKLTGKLIDKGYSIVIFPEGTRSMNGKIKEFKTGIGLIVSEMKVPVIPVKIEGLFNILPKGATKLKKGKATVSFGEPIYFENNTSYIDITKKIEEEVKNLQ